jgi:hypothetical protein
MATERFGPPRKRWVSGRRRTVLAALAAAMVAGAVALTSAWAFADASFADGFEDGDLAGWSKSGGTWAVAADGSRALRQTKLDSELARVFAGDSGWTDYTLQARVKPLAFAGADRFAGIAVRAQGSTAFYRLVLLGNGRAEVQSVRGSAVTVVGGAAARVAAGGWYTLRLEVSGTSVRGFVDGTAVGAGTVTAYPKGRVGLQTFHATAAFDDVKVTPGAAPQPGQSPAPTAPKTTTPTPAATTAAPKPSSASPTPAKTTAAPTPTPARTTNPPAAAAWPTPTESVKVDATIPISGTKDFGLRRYFGIGDGGQGESQDPMFRLADGAVLKNVIIGAPAGDGVHCQGSCTLINVWWEDVGEDAATFRGGANATYLIDGGGARSATDKTFQHNGGGKLTIRNFQISNFGKLYRSCGNCSTQHKRSVVIENVTVTAPGKTIAGINVNFGDTVTLTNVTIVGDSGKKISLCDRFTGNTSGAEPTKIGSGPDGTSCKASGIVYK